MMRKIVPFALLVFGASALADPVSIQERQNRADQEKQVARQVKGANAKCGTVIPEDTVMDWSSWRTARDGGHQAAVFCEYGIDAVRDLCADHIAQESIAKHLKRIVCAGDAPDKPWADVKGDTLVLHTSLTTSSANVLQAQTRDAVSKHLQ